MDQRNYATDYIVLAILFLLDVLLQLFVEPWHRLFSLDDISIQYPHADPEHVPPLMLLIYAIIIPLGTIAAWGAIFRPGRHKVHVTFLGLVLSIFMTAFITDVIKNAVGRPRPDLLSRCKPREDTPRDQLVGIDVCTETAHHLLHDGWRSFPSGHSSSAFSGLGYLALVIASQTHALKPSTPLPLALLPLVPLIGAALIAISRTEDYRHDVFDVTTGSLLGCVVALASYRRYYPSLWARGRSDMPHPPPGFEPQSSRKRPPKDEEFALASEDEDAGEDYTRLSHGEGSQSREMRG